MFSFQGFHKTCNSWEIILIEGKELLNTLFYYFWNNRIFTTSSFSNVSTCQRCNNQASFAMETENNKKNSVIQAEKIAV